MGLWGDNGQAMAQDRGLGSRLDTNGVGGSAVAQWRRGSSRGPHLLSAVACRYSRAASIVAIAQESEIRAWAAAGERYGASGGRMVNRRFCMVQSRERSLRS